MKGSGTLVVGVSDIRLVIAKAFHSSLVAGTSNLDSHTYHVPHAFGSEEDQYIVGLLAWVGEGTILIRINFADGLVKFDAALSGKDFRHLEVITECVWRVSICQTLDG